MNHTEDVMHTSNRLALSIIIMSCYFLPTAALSKQGNGYHGAITITIQARLDPNTLSIQGTETINITIYKDTSISTCELFAPAKDVSAAESNYMREAVYNSDPLEGIPYDSDANRISISNLRINGEQTTLKDQAKLIPSGFILVLKQPVNKNTPLEISILFKTRLAQSIHKTILPMLWFPSPKLASMPGFRTEVRCKLRIPNDYGLVSSGYFKLMSSDEEYKRYLIISDKILFFMVIAPGLALKNTIDNPVKASVWGQAGLDMRRVVKIATEEMKRIYECFGRPNSEYPLNIVVTPFIDYMAGASFANLIIVNSSSNRPLSKLIRHELVHFWWQISNEQSGTDYLFKESLALHLSTVMDQEGNRTRKGIIDKIKSANEAGEYEHILAMERSNLFSCIDARGDLFLEENYIPSRFAHALNALCKLNGKTKWMGRLRKYYHALDEAPTYETFLACNKDLKKYLDNWRDNNAYVDYALDNVSSDRTPDRRFKNSITIRNGGGIVMPVHVLSLFENGSTRTDTIEIANRLNTLTFDSSSKLKKVIIDPEAILPDCDRSNNRNFRRLRISFPLPPISNDEYDSYTISIIPFPLPYYSDENGWEVVSPFIEGHGLAYAGGIAYYERNSHQLLFLPGFNWKENAAVWSVRYSTPIHLPGAMGLIRSQARRNSDHSGSSMALDIFKFYHLTRPPLHQLSIFAGYDKLLQPAYRLNTPLWATGKLAAIGLSYNYRNFATFSHPVKGIALDLTYKQAIKILGGKWSYSKFSYFLEYYTPLPMTTIFALRPLLGTTVGNAPLQERFDLSKDALFSSSTRYNNSSKHIVSLVSELRFRKHIPILDLALFSRNAWTWKYEQSGMKAFHEAGISLRLWDNGYLGRFRIAAGLDFTLWRKFPGEESEGTFAVQLKLGTPFRYSSTRWYKK